MNASKDQSRQPQGRSLKGGGSSSEKAKRYLLAARECFEGLMNSLDILRQNRGSEAEKRGRLPESEVDLLRAAIVFTCAGLDASLKQLIRDTLPHVLNISDDAQDEFVKFVERIIGPGGTLDPKRMARYLSSPDPRGLLIEDYIDDLTGSSLQSLEQIRRASKALGIADEEEIRNYITEVRELFEARNHIAHELDLQHPEKRGDRARRSRKLQETKNICEKGFELAGYLISKVESVLEERPMRI